MKTLIKDRVFNKCLYLYQQHDVRTFILKTLKVNYKSIIYTIKNTFIPKNLTTL